MSEIKDTLLPKPDSSLYKEIAKNRNLKRVKIILKTLIKASVLLGVVWALQQGVNGNQSKNDYSMR